MMNFVVFAMLESSVAGMREHCEVTPSVDEEMGLEFFGEPWRAGICPSVYPQRPERPQQGIGEWR